jgi:deoxyribodipyrimidine photo-lyase
MVPASRIRPANAAPLRPDRAIVLYWMIATRRTRANYALERALWHARTLAKPLVVLEALRVDHEWASRRFHAFVLDGMRDNQAAMARQPGVTYYPYLEPCRGAARGLVDALAASAAVVVTDEFPAFFLPAMVERVGRRLDVSLEAVDSYGLLPLRAFDRAFGTAQAFRRAWQGALASHLAEGPARDPWADPLAITPWRLPAEIAGRWPDVFTWLDSGHRLDDVPVDHAVGATPLRGGAAAAQARLTAFVAEDLAAYGEGRNDPDRDRSSGLSPYLHWGHIGAHEVFERLIAHEGWLGHLPSRATGAREGWWGMSPAAESFLDELVTWREIGGNMSVLRPHDYDRYESLPAWARQSLDRHAADPRDPLYELDAFERAETHDPLWNAAQRQLVRDGRIHNYLRMLWGKKILQWAASPREALEVMIHLNNKYALDGRDPNSYSGIFWVLGRYDRPWAPERPVFGVIRYMSSENTARKVHVKQYLARYGAAPDTKANARLF